MNWDRFIVDSKVDEVYHIECPVCDEPSEIVGVNRDGEAIHLCQAHGFFVVAINGDIEFLCG